MKRALLPLFAPAISGVLCYYWLGMHKADSALLALASWAFASGMMARFGK
jgi:hypothetical protein